MQRNGASMFMVVCMFTLSGQGYAQLPDLVDVSVGGSPDYCGIDFEYHASTSWMMDYGGLAVADADGDGWLDVFFCDDKGSPNHLYVNQRDGTFIDRAAELGVDDPAFPAGAALFVDYDNDGDLDLFVGGHAGDGVVANSPDLFRLFRNHENSYTNVTPVAGFEMDPTTSEQTLHGWVGGVTAADINVDGYTDIFVGWWMRYPGPIGHDDLWRLWRSDPNGSLGSPDIPSWSPRVFTDITKSAGLDMDLVAGEAHQAVFVDLNHDGYPDLHVPVDFGKDRTFINQQDETFIDVATSVGLNGPLNDDRNEMGVALGDPDHDCDQDLHITNVGNLDRYFRNDSVGNALSFVDIGLQNGTNNSGFGWGTVFFDIDNDRDLDHAAVSGRPGPSTQYDLSNRLHRNEFPQTILGTDDVLWTDVSTLVPQYSKTDQPQGDAARSLAAFDYDHDGDLDLIVGRMEGKAVLYRNTLSSGFGFLQVDLVRADRSKNVTGSRAWLKTRGGPLQYREVYAGSSNMTQEPSRLHFGLGGVAVPVEWVAVRWPDQTVTVVRQPAADRVMTLQQSFVDDRGDMDLDGHLTHDDLELLRAYVADAAAFESKYPSLAGRVTGDIDGDGQVTPDDLRLFGSLPPH